MNEKTSSTAPSPNQPEMNTSDLTFLTKNEISHPNISHPAHNLLFYNSNTPILHSSKLSFSEPKEQLKSTSSPSNPENYAPSFENNNVPAPLNIQSNSFENDQEQKPYKNLPESDDEENENPSENTPKKFESSKLEKYLELMNHNEKNSHVYKKESLSKPNFLKEFSSEIEEMEKKLVENSILKSENEESFVSIQVKNIISYGNYEIIDLDVCIGKYEKNVKIYNSIEDSCFHLMKPFNEGSFGSIYLFKFMGDEFVVKCVSKTNRNNFENVNNFREKPAFLKEILKEYMINCIAGILEIGPKVLSPFGFDLIVSKKCIEFFVEKCTAPHDNLGEIHKKFPQIKDSLFQLHLLNIVHNDIKPENIMYNERTENLCFIDFGLSELSEKPIGHDKETKFLGTYKYASREMQKLLFENESGMIDLYYNDAYSLNMALNELFQIQKMVSKSGSYEERCASTSKKIENNLNIIYLKFLIWKEKVDEAITLTNIIGLKTNLHLQFLILKFIQKNRHSSKFKYFYHETFHHSVKEDPKFKRLKESFLRNMELELEEKDEDYKDFRDLYEHLENMEHEITEKETSFKQRSTAKDQKKQLILGKVGNLTDEQVWFIYVEFVNFLKKNEVIPIQEKTEVSLFMMKRFKINWEFTKDGLQKEESALAPIAECLYFLLRASLGRNVQDNQFSQVPKLISLLIILGWNVPEEVIVEWRETLCLCQNDVREKIISYLDFQIIQQICLNRYFKFQNEKCLKEIGCLIRAKKEEHETDQVSKESFYHNLIDERKRQNINNETEQLLNIVIQLLEFNFNPQIINETKLDQLVEDIDRLSHNLFKTKTKYVWVKGQLLFWVNVKYSIIRIDQEKQLKLLEKIKSLQTPSSHRSEIPVYQFELIALYHNLKNLRHLKLQLESMDEIVNCDVISENICISRRLMLSFMLKDFEMFREIIRKVEKIYIKDITDINLLRHTAYVYQNIFIYSLAQNTENEYLDLLESKIEPKMKQFIVDFHQDHSLKANKLSRLSFAQFLRAIFGIGFQSYTEFEHTDRIFSGQNLHFYIKVLENLSSEFEDIELKTTYLTEQMNLLSVERKFGQACTFLEQQNHIKFSDFSLSNYREASILINYYFLKINSENDEKDIYINKLKEIYQEMVDKGSYNFIFNNRKLVSVILNNLESKGDIFHFFKAMTEHLTLHPSRQNVEVLQSYLMDFVMTMAGKYKPPKELTNLYQENQALDIQSLRWINEAEKKKKEYFQEFYNYLKSEVNFKRLWENPYMMLIIYAVSYYGQLEEREVMKVNKMLCRNLEYLNATAKEFIFNHYYWIISVQEKKKNSKRINNYLLKKHLKATSQTEDFEEVLKIRSNRENLLLSHYMEFPGQSHIRKKMYRYYDNLEVLNKVNYLDSLSTIGSDRSLAESIF